MIKCEACEQQHKDLICCAGTSIPALWFCPEHYIAHVNEGHDGVHLPGCFSIEEAQKKQNPKPEDDDDSESLPSGWDVP